MDPETGIQRMLEAVRDEDHAETSAHAKAMEDWLNKGGFMPELTREQLIMLVQSVNILARRKNG